MTVTVEPFAPRLEDSSVDWTIATPNNDCEELVAGLRDRLLADLPRTGMLLYRLVEGYGSQHPELAQLLELFSRLSGDVKMHLAHEQAAVLPRLRDGNACDADEAAELLLPLEAEQHVARHLLAEIRARALDYRPPTGACVTHRQVLIALESLERDLNDLFGFEDNILFPKVMQGSHW